MRNCKQHANRHISLFSDPYVKVWLMHKDKRVEKKKTVVMKRCLNPVFNESFPFDVPAHVLRETTIIITVMDKDRLSRNDVIGKVSPSLFFASPFFFSSSVFFWLCDRTVTTWSLIQSLLTPAGTRRFHANHQLIIRLMVDTDACQFVQIHQTSTRISLLIEMLHTLYYCPIAVSTFRLWFVNSCLMW